MKVLVRVKIADELPPNQELLFEGRNGTRLLGYYEQENNSAENVNENLEDVVYWYKEMICLWSQD